MLCGSGAINPRGFGLAIRKNVQAWSKIFQKTLYNPDSTLYSINRDILRMSPEDLCCMGNIYI